jgi:hypothetical protein
MTLRLVKMAGHRLVKDQFAGIPEDDVLLQARVTIEAVAEGRGGPRAAARLAGDPTSQGNPGPQQGAALERVRKTIAKRLELVTGQAVPVRTEGSRMIVALPDAAWKRLLRLKLGSNGIAS